MLCPPDSDELDPLVCVATNDGTTCTTVEYSRARSTPTCHGRRGSVAGRGSRGGQWSVVTRTCHRRVAPLPPTVLFMIMVLRLQEGIARPGDAAGSTIRAFLIGCRLEWHMLSRLFVCSRINPHALDERVY